MKPNLKFAALKLADFWVGFGLGFFCFVLFCLGVVVGVVCLGFLNFLGGGVSLKSDKIWFHGNAGLYK